MENKAKPRICEVLGVEVGERFTADYPYKDLGKMEIWKDGNVLCEAGNIRSNALCYIINHPECIHKIPRWTPEEVELAKAIKVVWPTAKKLCPSPLYNTAVLRSVGDIQLHLFELERFPTLESNTALLSDIIGSDENN